MAFALREIRRFDALEYAFIFREWYYHGQKNNASGTLGVIPLDLNEVDRVTI